MENITRCKVYSITYLGYYSPTFPQSPTHPNIHDAQQHSTS